ncbi:MAG: sigma-70 family RNA polymerase sigma factor [Myxococcales bacterium]|nr:sigma-70 family RNA polymerase sigma factor [Myxococcales bacterium]
MARYAQSGDRAAFNQIFDRYQQRVHRFFARSVRDPVVASDLVQTTFLHVHRGRRDFDPSRTLRPWLFAIAANVRRDHWRRRSRRPEEPLDPGREIGVAPDASTATDRLVRRAIETLPDNQREVVLLRWYSGLTFPEIAEVLGINTTAAKVRSHRATKALRVVLGVGDGAD